MILFADTFDPILLILLDLNLIFFCVFETLGLGIIGIGALLLVQLRQVDCCADVVYVTSASSQGTVKGSTLHSDTWS